MYLKLFNNSVVIPKDEKKKIHEFNLHNCARRVQKGLNNAPPKINKEKKNKIKLQSETCKLQQIYSIY